MTPKNLIHTLSKFSLSLKLITKENNDLFYLYKCRLEKSTCKQRMHQDKAAQQPTHVT